MERDQRKVLRVDLLWALGGGALLLAFLLWATESTVGESAVGAGIFVVIGATVALMRFKRRSS
ncbi:hypothetical protein [Leifsonia sp. PS1209]|uniref:hypothetical protein n=1 Tax=Leifsonia sp. PS1209 TaxID=2724914 RepID=UPI001442E4AA|nr:hypothetical protein [Leifsonia sp. PS1209]QIZ99999.1 hypothetical protein HF024_16825 [Leifsonia sp. PS1209]